MRKKLLDFMWGRLGIFVCIAILFQLLVAVPGTAGSATVKVLVVGGGGGGANQSGGGGGAGGYRYDANFVVSPQAYAVTVGNGGAGKASGSGGYGSTGDNSVFSTITANGGGGGGYNSNDGLSGGSGGGGSGSYRNLWWRW